MPATRYDNTMGDRDFVPAGTEFWYTDSSWDAARIVAVLPDAMRMACDVHESDDSSRFSLRIQHEMCRFEYEGLQQFVRGFLRGTRTPVGYGPDDAETFKMGFEIPKVRILTNAMVHRCVATLLQMRMILDSIPECTPLTEEELERIDEKAKIEMKRRIGALERKS